MRNKVKNMLVPAIKYPKFLTLSSVESYFTEISMFESDQLLSSSNTVLFDVVMIISCNGWKLIYK